MVTEPTNVGEFGLSTWKKCMLTASSNLHHAKAIRGNILINKRRLRGARAPVLCHVYARRGNNERSFQRDIRTAKKPRGGRFKYESGGNGNDCQYGLMRN